MLLLALISPGIWWSATVPSGATQDFWPFRVVLFHNTQNRDCGSTGSWRSSASVGQRSFLFVRGMAPVGLGNPTRPSRTSRPLARRSIPRNSSPVWHPLWKCAVRVRSESFNPIWKRSSDSLLTPILRFELITVVRIAVVPGGCPVALLARVFPSPLTPRTYWNSAI